MPKVKGEINLFLDLSHKKYGKNEKCTGNSRGNKEKFMGNNVNSAGKILLIATGGTIACRETGHGLTPVLDGEGLLRELRLLPYFDVVVSSAAVGHRKPDPVVFDLACEEAGVAPSDAVHVGDRPDADGEGAQRAGLRPVIVDRRDAEDGCPYERILTLTDLPKLL